MKPKDLKYPFRWEERRVLIFDRVWYLPAYLEEEDPFQFPGFEASELFGNMRPVNIEYCSGNGSWIAEKAKASPDVNFLAVEKRFDRVQKIWSKIKNYQLKNLVVVCGEAMAFTQKYLPDRSVDAVYVNFPDPWPKKKHAKHRIIQEPFADELSRILGDEGSVTLVTDDAPYSSIMIDVFDRPDFASIYPKPYFVHEFDQYGTSYFDSLWREKGRLIRYHQFQKRGVDAKRAS